MVQITEYLDYREFLRDLYLERKNAQHFFSYRFFGMRIGLDAGNLVKIISGQRHLPSKAVDKVAEFCGFNPRERRYFKTLVAFCKAKKQDRISHYFEKLTQMRDVLAQELAPNRYEFYREWYHTAIVGLLHLQPFKGSNAQLAEMLIPRISAEEAKKSISLLLRLGLLSKEPDGTLVPIDRVLTTGEKWYSAAVTEFQKETIRLASLALESLPKAHRDISTLSVTLNTDDLEEIREVTREYRKAVLKIARASENPDRVCQLNIQLFPLTQKATRAERQKDG